MSLVGPRPLVMEFLPLYSPEQARRHEVRPGITGWAQVNGRSSIEREKRLKHDVWYVDHWSLWLDLVILGMTPIKILTHGGDNRCQFIISGGIIGPGRPGWLPTQVPHRSGLAHHAHPVPHLMNSRPARSVVGTWTWFRSRCTCQVSLQRLMRRHPLPLTGFLGLVPPLQRYYEVLRLPAAHFAALRFLRLAIPSLRPLFVPPGPGRGAVDPPGVGRRYLQPPCSMETTGSPKFPEEPL